MKNISEVEGRARKQSIPEKLKTELERQRRDAAGKSKKRVSVLIDYMSNEGYPRDEGRLGSQEIEMPPKGLARHNSVKRISYK